MLALATGVAVSAPAFGQSAEQVLRIGMVTPPPHLWTRTAVSFSEALGQRTNGRLSLSVFPSSQLGSEAQMLQLLQIGALDFGFFTSSEFANRLSDFASFYAPYLAHNAGEAARLLEGEAAADILSKVERLGLIGLGYGMAGMRQVVCRGEVRSLSDLRGVKVRVVPDAPLTDFWRQAGSAPTPVPLSSLYDAFANGQVDAMHIDFENTLRQKFYQHARTILHTDHMMFPMVAVASQRTWAGLSVNDREIIQAILDTELAGLRNAYVEADPALASELVESGAEITKAHHEFFADASQRWLMRWEERARSIPRLRAEASAVRSAAGENS